MVVSPLKPNIKLALERLKDLGRAAKFDEFACIENVTVRGVRAVNVIRHLKRAGYVENVVKGYERDEPYDGPRLPRYQLTPLGIRALISGNCERG